MTEGTITITSDLSEQELVEQCLMLYHSGYEWYVPFVFHAIACKWKHQDIVYYINLIEEDSRE